MSEKTKKVTEEKKNVETEQNKPKETDKNKQKETEKEVPKEAEKKCCGKCGYSIFIIIFVILALAGGGAYYYFFMLQPQSGPKEVIEHDKIYTLSDFTFEKFTKENTFVIVKYFAPWCGHCKALAPEYIKAAATMNKVKFAEIDCEVSKTTCEKAQVRGYPTVNLYLRGELVTPYEGERNEQAIVKWLNKKTEVPFSKLDNQEAIQAFIGTNDIAVIYFGSGNKFDVFSKVALKNDDVEFGLVLEEELFQINNVKQADSIVLYKKFDELRNDYEGEITEDLLQKFIAEKSKQTLGEFTMKTVKQTFQSGKPFFILFDKVKNSDEYIQFKGAAIELKDQIIFSYTDGSEIGGKLAEIVGAEASTFPCVYLLQPADDLVKFKLDKPITQGNIKAFFDDWKNEKLEAAIKSEDIPKTQDKPVFKLVALNYDEVVTKSNKDVLIKFYAPWCGHCKALAPIFTELAEILKVNPNIIIAELDATKNDIKGIDIKGYPTIKFFKNGKKSEPMEYEGERDLKGFLIFLKEQTTHPWVETEGEKPKDTITIETPQTQEKKNEEL